ncbi:TonB family protein [Candidatus Poribacteria bacterium]
MNLTRTFEKSWMKFLLISLCIHIAAFIFMGAVVLHNDPEAHESVSVQLLKPIQQEQKLRRNPPEPRTWAIARAELPKKARDVAKPAIKQGEASSYSATEVIPVFQDESVEARQSKAHPRRANRRNSLAVPKMDVSKPAASNAIAHNPQENILRIYEELSDLSASRNAPSLPDGKSSDPSILKDFLRTIGRKIEKSKRYPGWAMDAGLEGKVVVRFTISRDGGLDENPQLVRSSGAEILDNAAIAAIKNAAPFPALPGSLSREWLQVELPMDFRLTES